MATISNFAVGDEAFFGELLAAGESIVGKSRENSSRALLLPV
ncbi:MULTISPECIES: hypothetical protein [unclassified Endozoicomonas]